MNQQEITRAALLMAAQGDPKKAAEMEAYLSAETQQYPAGGFVPGPETVRPTIQTEVHPDGIYLVFGHQSPVILQKYEPGTVTEDMKERCTGIGIKLGCKSICVSLYNMADDEEITLTAGKDTTDWDGYKDNTLDTLKPWALTRKLPCWTASLYRPWRSGGLSVFSAKNLTRPWPNWAATNLAAGTGLLQSTARRTPGPCTLATVIWAATPRPAPGPGCARFQHLLVSL